MDKTKNKNVFFQKNSNYKKCNSSIDRIYKIVFHNFRTVVKKCLSSAKASQNKQGLFLHKKFLLQGCDFNKCVYFKSAVYLGQIYLSLQ